VTRPGRQSIRARTRSWLALCVVACSCALTARQAASSAAQTAEGVTRLEAGAAIGREISGGRVHVYQMTLSEGQYERVLVEHRGIDLVARVLGPDGAVQIETESRGRDGRDVLALTAERSGAFDIKLEPRYPKAPAGTYEIAIGEPRAASERDRLLYEAHRQSSESARLYRSSSYDSAQLLAERALETREHVLGPDHPDVAASLEFVGLICAARSDFDGAETLYLRALAIYEKAPGRDPVAIAEVLDNLAKSYTAKANYAQAERLAKQALSMREAALGADHFLVAASLGTLAEVYVAKRDLPSAQVFSDRALEVAGKAYGPDDLTYTDFMNLAGRVQVDLGNYSRAEELLSQALHVRERVAGSDSLEASDSMYGVGYLALIKADNNIKAEQMLSRALAIKEKIAPDQLQVGASLNGLGLIAYRRRDYSAAETYFKREIAITEKTAGPSHPQVAHALNNLGLVYWRQDDYARATELFGRALELCEKIYGPDSLNVALALANLGIMAKETGDYERGEAFYERALAIKERVYGKQHPAVAQSVEDLGILYRDAGDYVRAEPMFLRALEITKGALGVDHPTVARHLRNLAQLYSAKGDLPNALGSLRRAAAIEEKDLPLDLAIGSERQKLAYFGPFGRTLEEIISFQARQDFGDGGARDLAATTLLQRKGRVLDAMADGLGALRHRSNTEDLGLLGQLDTATSQLASTVLNGPQRISLVEHQQRITALTEQRDALENAVTRRSAGYYERTDAVTLEAIKSAVPADAALIEFAVYRPHDPKKAVENVTGFEEPRYVAYVIRSLGDVRWKDLGPARDIDRAVDAWRQALRDPARSDATQLARALDEKIMQPVRAMTGEAIHLLVSADGQLNLIPFEALVGEQGRYLVERYAISYLTTGRDLLRLRVPRGSRSEPVVVANPFFGEPAAAQMAGTPLPALKSVGARTARRSMTTAADLSSVYFAPLTGTGLEARTIKSLFPDARLLTGSGATKAALKQVNAPSILHIATHGFFLQETGREAIQNPLLRSGLALSGANLSDSATEDGILTALEASNLNLWGTKLVTLSACDTGVGEVKNGEGVYGLRRAFFLAGAETLVMSLWPVSDSVTREMMTTYYGGLKTGLGRGEALRQAQLAMLMRKNRQHPFYWASFIQAGEWANLDGQR
jgi:CHAT domain-containing protein/Tfp pilus assembly protein PilF